MGSNAYQGVILAAGHGSRMGPFGDAVPKPIVPICNKPLLAYQLESMQRLGIEDVLVVIGHLGHRIIQTIGNGSQFGVRVRYVEQERRLGLAHAVGQLEPHVDRPFLLMLGDIFFNTPNLGEMLAELERHACAAVLAVKEETDPEAVKRNFSVHLREDGAVRRVIEKPRHVSNLLKGCGIYLFDMRIFDAIRRTPRTAMRDEYELTDSIQILIDLECPVRVASVVEWDVNITFIGDLITCCTRQLKVLGKSHLVGEGCSIPDGVTLIDSVLGDHVVVEQPMTFERCVVLPGVRIAHGPRHQDTVFTPEDQFQAAAQD